MPGFFCNTAIVYFGLNLIYFTTFARDNQGIFSDFKGKIEVFYFYHSNINTSHSLGKMWLAVILPAGFAVLVP